MMRARRLRPRCSAGPRWRAACVCGGALAACGLAACGTHHRARASICTPRALAALAAAVGVPSGRVSTHAGRSSQSTPQCTFSLRTPAGQPVRVRVTVEVTRQAYFLVTRAAVEASQIFGPTRFETAPQQIDDLGLVADWFPDQQHLLATDGARLVTATVTFPAAPAARRVALAVAVTRPYLGPNVNPPVNGV